MEMKFFNADEIFDVDGKKLCYAHDAMRYMQHIMQSNYHT